MNARIQQRLSFEQTESELRRVVLIEMLADWRMAELPVWEDPNAKVKRREPHPLLMESLERVFGTLTLQEVGTLYRITRERARQIEEKAMGKIKRAARFNRAPAIREFAWT